MTPAQQKGDLASPGIVWPAFRRSLVAILRGIRTFEVEEIVGALIEEGFEAIEVPLNSPSPFTSIEQASSSFGETCLVGAGTVLSVQQVDRLSEAGGRLLVSPNVDPAVICRGAEHGMVTMPGVFTPTEALMAISCGASALKFFPAGAMGSEGIAAIRTILPPDTHVGVVGGVSQASFAQFKKVGVRLFGLGSGLYSPGDSASDVRQRARQIIASYDEVFFDQRR